MKKLIPQDEVIQQYVEYYWFVDRSDQFVSQQASLYEFPSLSPELIVGLKGSFDYQYKGNIHTIRKSTLFLFIDEGMTVFPGKVDQMVVVKFRPMGLSAVMPFLPFTAQQLISHHVLPARDLFGDEIGALDRQLDTTFGNDAVGLLDHWFRKRFNAGWSNFMLELNQLIQPTTTVSELQKASCMSSSSLDRHFKRSTGLSPKQYLMLNRFKQVIEELQQTNNTDWFDYVVKYRYHDQNHLIKEIKRFSNYTPTRLLALPRLLPYRP